MIADEDSPRAADDHDRTPDDDDSAGSSLQHDSSLARSSNQPLPRDALSRDTLSWDAFSRDTFSRNALLLPDAGPLLLLSDAGRGPLLLHTGSSGPGALLLLDTGSAGPGALAGSTAPGAHGLARS
jgi:hypothetical protein